MPSLLENLNALRARLVRSTAVSNPARQIAGEILYAPGADLSDLRLSVPVLFTLVFDTDESVAADAAQAVSRLVSMLPLNAWPTLGLLLDKIGPQELDKLARFGANQTVLLGLSSFHASGYVREAAVKCLASQTNGDELPFLLHRVNDWVDKVHATALDACVARVTPEYAGQFVANLPLVLPLAEAKRHDLTPFVQAVEGLLTRPECRHFLLDGMFTAMPPVRRACVRLALTISDEDLTTVFRNAFASDDPAIRRMVARALRARPAGDALQTAFMPQLAHDALAANRREYLYLIDEKSSERAAWALRNALTDEHRSVRETARYYLQKRETIDFAQFYRATLAAPETPKLAATLSGLGETGTREDAAQVAEYLANASADVRQAAVGAVGKLNGAAYLPQLMDALNDERSRVSRAARMALTAHLSELDDAQLWQRFVNASIYYGVVNCLRLMLEMPKWRGGVLLVKAHARAIRRNKTAHIERTQAALTQWLARFNESAAFPTREQLAQMRQDAEGLDDATRPEVEGIIARTERLLR